MEELLAPSENVLCEICTAVLRKWSELWPTALGADGMNLKFTPHHANGSSFEAAAKYGCRVCQILWQYHVRAAGSNEDEFYTTVMPGGCCTVEPLGGWFSLTVWYEKRAWDPYRQLELNVLLKKDEAYRELLNTCRRLQPSRSLDDTTVIQQARQWLSLCLTDKSGSKGDHSHCRVQLHETFLPRRLLDIRNDNIILSTYAKTTAQLSYCALSYCWGNKTAKSMLTMANEEQYHKGISEHQLPQTIQDAIYVTRKLGIAYIWIDLLCIIQDGDGGKDWLNHSRDMSKIYSNCVLNLSADRASSMADGFLGPRSAPALRPLFISQDHPSNLQECIVSIRNVEDIALSTEPLGSRGWVLSERILSPRTLHFCAGEIFWECNHGEILSESCPNGFKIPSMSYHYARYNLEPSTLKTRGIRYWDTLLTNYTQLHLSEAASDKLLALAGVARHFEERTNLKLIAGVIQGFLPRSLMWYRREDSTIIAAHPPRKERYTAPSWSWASLDGPLQFQTWLISGSHVKVLAELLDVWVKPVDPLNHLGQLEDGALVIQGPVRFLTEVYPNWASELYKDIHGDNLDNAIVLFVTKEVNDQRKSLRAIVLKPEPKEDWYSRRGILIMSLCRTNEQNPQNTTEMLEKCQIQTITVK